MKKKNLNIFLSYAFIVIFASFAIISCSKNEDVVLDDGNFEYRNTNMTGEFAKALSSALINEEQIRVFLKSEINNETNKYKEILLSCIKNEDIGDGRKFKDVLSTYFKGQSTGSEYDAVLEAFPTMSLSLPFTLSSINWDVEDLSKTPAIVYYAPDAVINYKGQVVSTPYFESDKTIYYINLRPSEGFISMNLVDSTINNSSIGFGDIIGNRSDSCKTSVKDYIDEIMDSCKRSENNVIISLDDLYGVLNRCKPVTTPDDTNTSSSPMCVTTPIREVDNDHFTYNYFDGFQLSDELALDYIDNQPGGENLYTFVFVWAHSYFDAQNSHKRLINVSRHDLYQPSTWVFIITDPDCDDYNSGNEQFCGYWKLVSEGYLKYFQIPEDDGRFMFGYSDSRWELDNIGKFYSLDICEYDANTTSASSSTTTSNTHKVDIQFSVPKFLKTVLNGGIDYTYTHSSEVKYSTTVVGDKIVPIGMEPVDWCDQEEPLQSYPWGTMLDLTLGVDVLEY